MGGIAGFDPTNQTFILLASDGETKIPITVAMADSFNREAISTSISYSTQIGALFIMLVLILSLTPSKNLFRPITVVHTAGLVVGLIRMLLAVLFFVSPWLEFYTVYSGDFSLVPESSIVTSVTCNTFTLILVMLIQAALILQAWAMAKIWHSVWKMVATIVSGLICLACLGFRVAYTVVQNRHDVMIQNGDSDSFVAQGTPISSAIMICWFCAIFNYPLVSHLVQHRGILPARRGVSPVEVLVMTNGILMVIPVIFAGLEYGTWVDFEPDSFCYTTVIIILPLGTLIAQRIAGRSVIGSSAYQDPNSVTTSHMAFKSFGDGLTSSVAGRSASSSAGAPLNSVVSRVEAGGGGHHHAHRGSSKERVDPVDLELDSIEQEHRNGGGGHVRVNRAWEQRDERV